MPDRAKAIARRVCGGLLLKQAMDLLLAGLAIVGGWQLVFGGGVQRAVQSQAALVVDNVDLAGEVSGGIVRIGVGSSVTASWRAVVLIYAGSLARSPIEVMSGSKTGFSTAATPGIA